MKLINPAHLRRLAPTVLLAATVTLAGSAVGEPATACAAPEWDVGAFDLCMKQSIWITDMYLREKICCTQTGGVWVTDKYSDGTDVADSGRCTAPPAEPAEAQPTLPGVAPPPVGATQTRLRHHRHSGTRA